MKKAFRGLITLCGLCILCQASPLVKRDTSDIHDLARTDEDLKSKLSRLQEVLQQLRNERFPTTTTTTTQTTPKQTNKKPDESASAQEPMKTEGAVERNLASLQNSRLRELAQQLTSEEKTDLRELKQILQDMHDTKSRRRTNWKQEIPGQLHERPINDGVGDPHNEWQKLVRQLQQERDALYLKNRALERDNKFGDIVEPEVDEGTFGPFQEQVVHEVENRLFRDLSMAVKNGVSVDDIIRDLQTQDGRTDSRWHWN